MKHHRQYVEEQMRKSPKFAEDLVEAERDIEGAAEAIKAHEDSDINWGKDVPHVRKAFKFMRKGWDGTAAHLVAWDASNGKKLFNWNDKDAAAEWRIHQARLFINYFSGVVNGMRVNVFRNVPATEETPRRYYSAEQISKTEDLRSRVIADIVKRMKTLASELKFLRLTEPEREAIIKEVIADI